MEVEVMANPALRDGKYYHRERVPQELLSVFERTRTGKPRTEVWIPLNTSSKAEANRRLPQAQVALRERFEAARRKMAQVAPPPSPATPQEKCQRFYETLQRQERERRAELVEYAKAHPDQFWRGDVVPIPSVKERGREGFHGVLGAGLAFEIQTRLNDAKGALSVMDMHYIRKATGETDEATQVLLARTEITFLEAMMRDSGALFAQMPPLGAVSLASSKRARALASDVPVLTAAAERWRTLRVREGWTEGGRMTTLLNTATKLLVEICGDKPLSQYGKTDVAIFKDTLSRLPRHRSKLPSTRCLSATEASRLGLPPIHLKTANDYLARITDLFAWAKLTFDGVDHNVFEGSGFAVRTNQREERQPFTPDELTLIFASLRRSDSAKFWAPILAPYTGCRSNEILKLKVSDVRQEAGTGIWYLDINEERHTDPTIHCRLKRSSHARRIPIHPDLVALGFLDFVKRCKGERLFIERKPDKFGKFSDAFGKWFNRHLHDIGVKRPKVDFHSFRHCFVDACDGRVPDDIIRRLKGDARGGTLDRYGSGKTDLQILSAHLNNICVAGTASFLNCDMR
jgi:integrase